MQENSTENPKVYRRLAMLALVLGLSLSNSALFYFVIWDMLSPSKPYTVILFFVSGGAHLVYVFLPWFAKEMLGPIIRGPNNTSGRYGSQDGAVEGDSSNFFINACTQFGLALGASAIGLWLLQTDLFTDKTPDFALITKANCLEIGGAPEIIDGKLICLVKDNDIRGSAVTPVSRREGRI